jgi:hypothetical protein
LPCIYNDYFNDTNLWSTTGSGTLSSISGRARLDIEDGNTNICTTKYQYQIAPGNFQVRISFNSYVPNNSTNGLYAKFYISSETGADKAILQYNLTDSGTLHNLLGSFIVNNAIYTDIVQHPSTRPVMFEIKRSGLWVSLYYYDGTDRYLVYRKNFGSRASNLTDVYLSVEHNVTYGGYAEFDDMLFKEGCPVGYPKAWTTTTSTTSSSSTTYSTISTTTTTC